MDIARLQGRRPEPGAIFVLAIDTPTRPRAPSPGRATSRRSARCVAHLIESDGPGGAERVLATIAGALQVEGWSNVAFLPRDGEGWLSRELTAAGIPVRYLVRTGPYNARRVGELAAAFRAHRVTIAHSHEFTMGVYDAVAAWHAGAGHVITMHGSEYFGERLRRRLALRAAVGLGGELVAVSQRLSDRLAAGLWLPRSRVTTIPNGVRAPALGPATLRGELGLTAADRLVLAVGNLYAVKGHRYLVDALGLLASRHPGLHVAIAGRGDLGVELRARADALGVADRLHLLGLRDDIGHLLAAADVFAMPSMAEGLPLALLEAMTAGLPIVATDVGDVGAALAGGAAGRLVPVADAPALAAAIDHLLLHPAAAHALGAQAARRARTEYSVDRMASRYVDVYRRLLGRAGIAPPVHAAPPVNREATRVATPPRAIRLG
jgi:glycosyltransferase involved in cell wall biosynthesis